MLIRLPSRIPRTLAKYELLRLGSRNYRKRPYDKKETSHAKTTIIDFLCDPNVL